ncbi:MAG: cellulose biosynthesis protein BcsG [Methylotenera sp.]|nr:cellulose biosynthesis protein BcsG [Methylotenera sp.]
MNYIGLYFLGKIGLFFGHYIAFNWILNLILALLAYFPIKSNALAKIRSFLVWILAAVLIYQESYLPTVNRIYSRLDALKGFDSNYMIELLGRVFNPMVVALIVIIIILYRVINSRLRISTFVFIGLLTVPALTTFWPSLLERNNTTASQNSAAMESKNAVRVEPQTELLNFYTSERKRAIHFSVPGKTPAFDVVMIHVCSISWDDLDFVNEKNHPLLKKFDLVFSNFNTAASYSGPAAIRLLRGTCGQSPHDKLYQSADPLCYVFPNLEKLGYVAHGMINHDGLYDKYLDILEMHTGLKGKLVKYPDAPVALRSFVGSPIYDDFSMLNKWWSSRLERNSAAEALYYQTITLHDGNIVPGQTSRLSLVTYKPRLVKFLAELDRFITLLENSGKPVVLMMVPEHGASLRGDPYQISGMREIPTPGITLGPAAIKLIGLNKTTTTPIVINEPVSFFGLYNLLGGMLAQNPFDPASPTLAARVKTIEKTKMVSENEDVTMLRDETGRYMMKSSNGAWVTYR